MLKQLLFILLFFFRIAQGFSQCTPGDILSPIDVDSVSVDIAGNVQICWQASSDPSISIYYIIGVNTLTGATTRLDSVNVPNLCHTVTAANNNVDNRSEEYAIGVKDSCGNELVTILDFHNTIFLQANVDVCTASILLDWNSYNDFDNLNVTYAIYASENGGPYISVGNTVDTSFSYVGINQGSTYDIYVTAFENGGAGPFSSSSNVLTINTTSFLVTPNFNYLYTVDVIDSSQISVQFYVDTLADVREYIIKRALNPNGSFTALASIPAFDGMNSLQEFFDFTVDAKTTSYYYQVDVINTCGQVSFTSNLGRSILLGVTSNNLSRENVLTWNTYEGWLGNVQEYAIYRSIGGVKEPLPIAVLPAQSAIMTYTDDISNILEGNGEFCYQIEAKENSITHVGNLPDIALSNSHTSCVTYAPLFYVPNAFRPSSQFNAIFKPVINYVDPLSYNLSIYSRWGQKVFETNDIETGWNGAFNNKGGIVGFGSYVYTIAFRSADGESFERVGSVILYE